MLMAALTHTCYLNNTFIIYFVFTIDSKQILLELRRERSSLIVKPP